MGMAANTTTATHYRKTKDGRWVVCGPVSVVRAGAAVTVTTKAGAHKVETIKSIGKPFDGMVYGYIDEPAPRRSTNERRPHGKIHCDECGEYVAAGSRCWETGITH